MTRVVGGPSYEELAGTVDELRAENARLRGLLGLDTRASDGHRRAWSPTLLTDATEMPVVDASAGEADKVALLRSLFGARSDVYATRWENALTGRSGWSPLEGRHLDRLAHVPAGCQLRRSRPVTGSRPS